MSDETVVLKPVTETEALTKAVSGATSTEDIRAAIIAEATNQTTESDRLAAEQAAAETARAATATTEAAKPFTCTEVIGGREFEFEAASQAELDREVANAYRVAYAVQPTTTTPEPVVDPAVAAAEAQAAADAEVARKAELELQFKRGDISAAQYIEQSGAIRDYLASEGVSIDSLKKTVDKDADAAETQSWADATESFLHGPAGSDWPGGQKNLKQIGDQIILMGLTDPSSSTYQPDKVAALAQAYAALKAEDRLFPPDAAPAPEAPATAGTDAPAPAAPAAAPAQASAPAASAPPRTPATSSSLFGKSSGTSAAPAAATAPAAASVIPPDASPAEILEAWKKGQLEAGQDPNAVFTETFSRARR